MSSPKRDLLPASSPDASSFPHCQWTRDPYQLPHCCFCLSRTLLVSHFPDSNPNLCGGSQRLVSPGSAPPVLLEPAFLECPFLRRVLRTEMSISELFFWAQVKALAGSRAGPLPGMTLADSTYLCICFSNKKGGKGTAGHLSRLWFYLE